MSNSEVEAKLSLVNRECDRLRKALEDIQKPVVHWLACRREWMALATRDKSFSNAKRDAIVNKMTISEIQLEAEAAKLKESAEAA
jgi:hypothetical protein